MGDEWAGGGLVRAREEGEEGEGREKRRWERGKIGEKGREGKRGNFARSKMRGRRQGGGGWGVGGVDAYPLPPHVC